MPVCDCKGEYIGAYQAINKKSGDEFNYDEDVRRLTLAAFICVLPDTDVNGAREFAESLRVKIMESICTFEGTDIKITMSFGITAVDPALSAEENIAPADKRLYTAKESGRNRVISPDE